jgi:dipeptidyl aminopeptidase/acylaminoacyl peptidase
MSTLYPVNPVAPPQTPAAGATPPIHHPVTDLVWPRRLVAVLLVISGLLMLGYAGVSLYAATLVHQGAPLPITQTPAALGLAYRDVTFPSRTDGLQLRGWFIPGTLPNGQLTAKRTIVFVHGNDGNRMAPDNGLLDLSAAFARHGFAVLAFDLRGQGESPPAVMTWGVLEQRDVLGAVDFLRSGSLPYPELGRPRVIGAWGLSLGAVSVLFAAVHEPALQAIVADTAYADALPILEREIPKRGGFPAGLTPGVLIAAGLINGINYYDIRPVDVVASLAPRPLYFIHGDHDDFTPPSDMDKLVSAARSAPNAQVQSWLVPGMRPHAHAFKVAGEAYVTRVVAFFEATLGSATHGA